MECTHCGSDMCDGRSCYDVSEEREPEPLERGKTEYRITGIMRFHWTDDHNHVYAKGIDIQPFPSLYPGLTVKDIRDWLGDVNAALGPSAENQEIEIIVRLKPPAA